MTAHQVRSVEVEITTRTRATAESLTDRVSRIGHDQLKSVLERVFNESSPGQRTRRLDTVELDLGSFDERVFDAEFLARVEQKLRAALASLDSVPDAPSAGRRDSLQLVAVFARTGNLLWWARTTEREIVLHHLRLLAREAAGELLGLLRTLLSDPPALQRLASVVDRSVLEALLREAQPRAAQELLEALDWLANLAESGAKVRVALETAVAWSPGLRCAVVRGLAGGHAMTEVDVLIAIVAALREREPIQALDAHAEADDWSGVPALLRARDARESWVVLRDPSEADVRPSNDARSAAANDDASNEVEQPAVEAAATHPQRAWLPAPAQARLGQPTTPPKLERHAARARRAALEVLEEVAVTNCGLVLLWPFLERYFERQGLCDRARTFNDWAAQSRAVRLLELLASGDPDPPEFRLPLAKLLCGMTPDADLSAPEPAETQQLEEAERLLAAAIDRLPGLRDLSIAAFRQLFLERPGVLDASGGAWSLRVEREGQDVVLSRAPWSWEWVRLPWMPDPIRVDW